MNNSGHDRRTSQDSLLGRAIPNGDQAMETMVALLRRKSPCLRRFADLGSIGGDLGLLLLEEFPLSEGVHLHFVDCVVAEPRHADYQIHGERVEHLTMSLEEPQWVREVRDRGPFEVIVSGTTFHRQSDLRKWRSFREIYDLLQPGGIFLNLDYVSTASEASQELFQDTVAAKRRATGVWPEHPHEDGHQTTELVCSCGKSSPAPAELQCDWLRQMGYEEVEVFTKYLGVGLFGGTRPRGESSSDRVYRLTDVG